MPQDAHNMLTYMRDMTQPEAVLHWVHTWHHSTSSVIARLLMAEKNNGDKLASNLLRRMCKQGLLRALDTDHLQGQNLYMLTSDGLEEVLTSGMASTGIRYDLKPSSIRHDLLRHDLGVQFIIAHLSNRQKIVQVIPESVLRKTRPVGKIPDAMIILEVNENQARVAIEFEREEKAGDRLERFLLNISSDLEAREYDLYLVYSRIPGIMKNYEKAAQGPLRVWEKGESKRWETKGTKTIPPEILTKIRFRFMPDIAAAVSPIKRRRKQKTAEGANAAS